MHVDRYPLIYTGDPNIYEFISEGPKGKIPKIVMFTPMGPPGLYNLAFGDKNIVTGGLNDIRVTNNGDTKKVLATVAYTLFVFTQKFPQYTIYAKGRTEARTRLYRMGISNSYDWLKDDFDIYGKLNGKSLRFEKNKNYEAFLAKRKKW